jgi:hypothetical protein
MSPLAPSALIDALDQPGGDKLTNGNGIPAIFST